MKDYDVEITICVPAENLDDAKSKIKDGILLMENWEYNVKIKEQGEWIE